jgi:hypothetical protein
MTTGYLISAFHAITTAASMGAAGTVAVAGIFTVIGAGIPLIYQVVSGHNQNRREDHWACVNAVADLIAAGHGVLLALPSPTAHADADAAKTASAGSALAEAFFRFDSAYARLVLVIPDLRPRLADLRSDLLLTANSSVRDISVEQRIQRLMDEFLNYVSPRLTFPVFKFVPRRIR